MVVPLNLPASRYNDVSAWSFYRALEQRMRILPGVTSVCYTDTEPFGGSPWQEFRLRGQDHGTGRSAMVSAVSVDCLRTFNLRATSGRVFNRNDLSTGSSTSAVVISEAFAHSFWPHEDPLDKVILQPNGMPLTVIGVIRDTKSENFGVTDGSRIYRLQEHPPLGSSLLLRFEGDSSALVRAAGEIVKSLDSDVIVTPRTVRSEIDEAAAQIVSFISLLIFLACGTVLLALIGIYGVVWFTVSRRTKEIAIRIALGATRRNVVVEVLRSNMRSVFAGLTAGLILAAIGSAALGRVSK